MNHERLMNAMKARLATDGRVSVDDVDLLIWTATSLQGSPMRMEPQRTIRLYCDSCSPQKIAAIKGLRQMTLDITGQAWGLKEAKEMIDRAYDATVIVLENVPLDRADAAVNKYNDLGSGYYAEC